MKSVVSTQNALRAIQVDAGFRQILKDIERNRSAMQSALAPYERFRQARLFDLDSPLRREIERASLAFNDLETRFRLPEMTETARLVAEFQKSPASRFLETYTGQAAELQRAIESMRTPWLDMHNTMRSIAAFTELQDIGHRLRSMPPFADDLAAALRVNLGDWRDPITWPPAIFKDLGARSDFYESLGFNAALTDFPAPAFEQSLDIARIRHPPPAIVELYGTPVPRSYDEAEEAAFARTNSAHDWLFRFETRLRAFIDERMTREFGSNWAEHRLPNVLHDKWLEKKRNRESAGGTVRPIIAYADFTDYELVICKRDNWREIFAPIFGRPESLRESLQRLYPIRLDTMHARPISQEDELFLHVETRRLMKIIVVRSN